MAFEIAIVIIEINFGWMLWIQCLWVSVIVGRIGGQKAKQKKNCF